MNKLRIMFAKKLSVLKISTITLAMMFLVGGFFVATNKAQATVVFDSPNYYYTKLTSAPASTWYKQAAVSPDGTKILAQKTWTDGAERTEIVLMNANGSGETIISPNDSGSGDIYGYMNPFWSDDGTAIGFAEVHNTTSNKIMRYDLGGSSTYIYEPAPGKDANNADFLGTSKTSIVFFDASPVGGADLFTWDGATLTNITNTEDYKEYEPVSNSDGTKLVYWSGETAAETINTTHTLTYSGGVWTKDVGFTPIPDTYWAAWTTPAAIQIDLTVMSSKDVLIYDNAGGLVTDLSGLGYSGGDGQWNFFGTMSRGPSGEFVLTSNAWRGATPGRDIIVAAPRTAMYVSATGSDLNPGTLAAPFATIQKAITEVATGGTVNVAAGTYTGSVTVNKDISIIGAGITTVIDPATDSNGFTITSAGSGATIQDLRITLSTSGVDAQAIRLEGAGSVTISGNTIETTGNNGVGIWIGNVGYTNSNSLTISNNTITIANSSTGIYAEGGSTAQTGWSITGNTITANNGNPLELYDVTNSTVSGNTFTTTTSGGNNVLWTSELSNLNNLIFSNNTLDGSFSSQVVFGTDSKPLDGTLDFGNAVITNITTVTISGNTFNNWDSSLTTRAALRIGYVNGTGRVRGVTINNNKFLSAGTWVRNLDADGINAQNNYWGSVSPDFGARIVLGSSAGAVDHTPWYVDEAKTTKSDLKAITGFTIPSQTGSTTIIEGAHTISVVMPYGTTDVTALVPTITYTGESVNPNTGVAHDFTTPATYTVTSIDGGSQDYTATVTIALNPAKAITAFTIPGQATSSVNEGAHTVTVTMPHGTVVTALVPAITITGASVSPNTGVAHDFTIAQTYTVTAADSTTQDYVVTVNLQVVPTLSVINSPVTYNGSAHTASVVATNGLLAVDGTVSNIKYNTSVTVPTSAGTYAITADFVPTDTTNYESLVDASVGSFVINKATPTLSITDPSVTYNGSPQSATVSAGVIAGVVSNIKYNTSVTVPTSAGTYAITADFVPTDTTNYESLVDASVGSFVINKATPTLSITDPSVTYNGSPQSATVSAGVIAGVVSNIKYNTSVTVPTSAGTYAITADFVPTDTTNYESLVDASVGSFVINKATATIDLTLYSVTYDGSPHTAIGTATGVLSADLSADLNLSGTTHTNAGDYTTDSWTFTDSTGNYENASGTIHNVITKANQVTLTINTFPASLTYGTTGTLGTTGGSGTGTVVYSPSTACSVSGTTLTVVNASNPCDITATKLADANYNSTTSESIHVTLVKASAIINVSGYTGAYDGSAHGASGTAVGVELTPADLNSLLHLGSTFTDVPGGTAHWTFDGNSNYNSTSGDVSITINQVSSTTTITCPASVGYTGSALTPCTVSVTGDGGLSLTPTPNYSTNTNVGTVSVSYTYSGDTNHTGSSDTKTFTINKATPTITWSNPADITLGAGLGSTQLNATSSGDGVATYTPTFGTFLSAGNAQDLSVTFAATANYNSATATVHINVIDPVAAAFNTVSSTLTGQHIANNLNTVNSGNVTHFTGLYFEKSILISGSYTPVGKLLFTGALDLSSNATTTFLQNLGSKLDQGNGRIAFDVQESTVFSDPAIGASLTMYNITPGVDVSKLIVRDDTGNIISPSGIVSGFSQDPITHDVTFSATHFTQFDIDTTAPVIVGHADVTVEATSSSGAVATYTAPNATDNIDPTAAATCSPVSGTTLTIGDHTVTCNKTDTAGNAATPTTFAIHVVDTTAPTITRLGSSPVDVVWGTSYTDAGATASDTVDGSLTSSIVVNNPVNPSIVGDYTVTYNVTDAHGNAATQVTRIVHVIKANQTINFSTLADKTYGDIDFTVSASATSGLSTTFTSSGACNVTGATVHIVSAGSCTITAHQSGNSNYNSATGVEQTFTINKATQSITWADPADITYGTALSGTQLNASSTGDGTPTYTPAAGTVLSAGNTQVLSVTFSATTNYNSLTQTAHINVNKATQSITWADPADITYGTALSGTQLNASSTGDGTPTYTPAAGTVLSAGNTQELSVTFSATTNYNSATQTAHINVLKSTPATPSAPTLVSKTKTSVTLTAVSGNEFSKDSGSTWQDSNVFSGLTANTLYTFTTRIKSTTNTNASLASAGLGVTTDPLSAAKAITAFSFSSGPGAINETAHTIAINVENGTNVTALIATFTTTGSSVAVGATPQVSATTANNFTSAVTYTVTAEDSSTQAYTVTVTVLPADQIPADTDVTVNATQSEVVVNSSEETTITVPSDVTDATVNIDSLTTDDGSTTTATLPAINLNVATSLSATAVNVEIPASTVVTAPTGWDGTINVPTVKANSTVTATPDSGKTATVQTVIEVGYGDVKLVFSNAVRILIPGQVGKDVGYSRSGVFTKITDTCSADTQVAGNALAAEGDCKIDVSPDLVIWTKHFTTFATYTQTTNSTGGGGGGGSSYSLSNLSVSINSNATTTNARNVTLTLTGTNASQMIISNDSAFAGSVYEAFTSSKAWTLSEGFGVKTVYVKFRNVYGVDSSVITDTITLAEGAVLGSKTWGNGTLVMVTGSPTVYMAVNNELRPFDASAVFNAHGLKFSDIQTISAEDLAASTVGKAVGYPDGTLVVDTTDNRTIYVIENGKKRGFVTWSVFTGLGYKLANAVKISLADYEAGEPISLESSKHPDGSLILSNGTIWLVQTGQRHGFPTAEIFNSHGYKFANVLSANSADLELPEGTIMAAK